MSITVQQLINGKKDSHLHAVRPDDMVLDAIRMMNDHEVGALLVMDGQQLAGMLSERDYTRKIILQNRKSSTTQVKEIMTAEVFTVAPEDSLEECMRIMSQHHIRHLPVMQDGKPIGVISIMDVLKNIISEKESIIGQLEHYITESI